MVVRSTVIITYRGSHHLNTMYIDLQHYWFGMYCPHYCLHKQTILQLIRMSVHFVGSVVTILFLFFTCATFWCANLMYRADAGYRASARGSHVGLTCWKATSSVYVSAVQVTLSFVLCVREMHPLPVPANINSDLRNIWYRSSV